MGFIVSVSEGTVEVPKVKRAGRNRNSTCAFGVARMQLTFTVCQTLQAFLAFVWCFSISQYTPALALSIPTLPPAAVVSVSEGTVEVPKVKRAGRNCNSTCAFGVARMQLTFTVRKKALSSNHVHVRTLPISSFKPCLFPWNTRPLYVNDRFLVICCRSVSLA